MESASAPTNTRNFVPIARRDIESPLVCGVREPEVRSPKSRESARRSCCTPVRDRLNKVGADWPPVLQATHPLGTAVISKHVRAFHPSRILQSLVLVLVANPDRRYARFYGRLQARVNRSSRIRGFADSNSLMPLRGTAKGLHYRAVTAKV